MKKTCSVCGESKPLSEYSFIVNKHGKTFYKTKCKTCINLKSRSVYDKGKERSRSLNSYYRNHEVSKEKAREKWRQKSKEKYNLMFLEQSGLCAVCGNSETAIRNNRLKDLAIDHDHFSGEVRGLLCQRCNLTLGLVSDDIMLLNKLILYLENHK